MASRGLILLLAFLFVTPVSAAGFAELKANWPSMLGGVMTTIAAHELGHFAVSESENTDAYYDGVTIRYRDTDGSDQQSLRLSSAGYQMQWLVSEYAFNQLVKEDLSDKSRAWNTGLVLGHLGISLAYLTVLIDHDDGDTQGVADSADLSTGQVALMLAIPALLDGWRLFGDNAPRWAAWTSRGVKVAGVAAIWEF